VPKNARNMFIWNIAEYVPKPAATVPKNASVWQENMFIKTKYSMSNTLTVETSVLIHARPIKVWNALISPELIKKWLMGTNVTTDWKEGSPIIYSGEHEGKQYHDKGIIKKFEVAKLLQTTYWSSLRGKDDKPENYNLVTYYLREEGDHTRLILVQDNIDTIEEKAHSTKNWEMVLQKLKELVEAQ
jgi:uncharacterized protein YndB with AHSA1/START domain